MKRIVLFDPSYGTSNMGDFIINEAIMSEMSYLFDQSFLVRYSTHSPLRGPLQQVRPNRITSNCHSADLKFIGGTNILKDNLFKLDPGWNVTAASSGLYSGAVCIGAGRTVGRLRGHPDPYTRAIYHRALWKRSTATRCATEKAKQFLESLGFKAINTGCPTTWGLTPQLAAEIPTTKAAHVVTTLTDYARDYEADSRLLDTLVKNYDSVSCWLQGSGDLDYFRSLGHSQIRLIPPSLRSFSEALDQADTEYVGTRLRAVVFAMQRRTRTLIISVDNRAADMAQSTGIPVLSRTRLDSLAELLDAQRPTELRVDFDAIKDWKSQFVGHV